MAAFDITTTPTSLTLKPGSTGSIMVIVSNRLGRPVTGVVEGVLNPAAARSWLVLPDNLRRRYEADPVASANYEFKVVVPQDAEPVAVQFQASAHDSISPDDSRVRGQTVAIDITKLDKRPSPPIRWWVWLIAGLVVVGAAIGIWLVVTPGKPPAVTLVPSVIGKSATDASTILAQAGFDSVVIKDTVGGTDTNRVVRQDPAGGTEMPAATEGSDRIATILIGQPAGKVPSVIGQGQLGAHAALSNAGFQPITVKDTLRLKAVWLPFNLVVQQQPVAGSELPPDSMLGKTPATIWISREGAVVPKVINLKLEDARDRIRKANLLVGRISEVSTTVSSRHGEVAETSPVAGKLVPKDTEIKLRVYRFPFLPWP